MATLRDIRHRITAVKNTAKITSAMRMVAAAKLRRAQESIMSARPYTDKMAGVLANLAASSEEGYFHPLLRKPDTIRSIAVIVISSDRGLCGSFNANLLRTAAYYIDNTIPKEFPQAKVSVYSVGKRSVNFFNKRSDTHPAQFPDIFAQLSFSTAQEIASLTSDGFINEKFDQVIVYYNEFISVIKQQVIAKQLLPVESKQNDQKAAVSDYLYEPNRGDIMDILLPKYLNNIVWKALLESNAAEQAARMMAMETATINARDLIKALQLSYNKARQASITTEMLEIVGGAEALKN